MKAPLFIHSVHNPRIKEARQLRERRGRQKFGLTLVDGRREVLRALDAQVSIVRLILCPDWLRPEDQEVVGRLEEGTEVVHVPAEVFAKIAFGDRHDGHLAVVVPPRRSLADFVLPPDPCVAVVEALEKPGNLGAVLRSADGAGLAGVIVADENTDLYNPNVIRASLGTVFRVPVCTASAPAALAWLRQHGLRIYAARVDADLPYYEADFAGPCAMVLGSEAEGLGELWHAAGVVGLRLPMHGVADSLNVSATAAVLFYEALRQRSLKAANGG